MPLVLEFQPFPAPGGPLSYAPVPWDAQLYGIPFYELRCDGLVEDVIRSIPLWRERRLPSGTSTLVQTRIATSDLRLAQALGEQGFYPAETTVHLALPLRRFAPISPSGSGRARLRPAQASDLPTLMAIAGETFSADRFHLDPHLPTELSDLRYAKWVERGARDGDPLFAYEKADDGEIMGFYLIRGEPGGEVDLSLAGVSARYRRGGVGALMYEAMLERCVEMGYRVATTTVSANNPDVLNIFMRLGFGIRSTRLTMHMFVDAESLAGRGSEVDPHHEVDPQML